MQEALPAGRSVEVFYDGDCPLCMREIRMLMRKDAAARIQFTNIAHPAFVPERYGKTHEQLMTRIHGRAADGRWIEGVEVFRQLYAAIGWRRLVAVSRLPGISHLLELAYGLFAANRLRLTGRCTERGCAIPRVRHEAPAPARLAVDDAASSCEIGNGPSSSSRPEPESIVMMDARSVARIGLGP